MNDFKEFQAKNLDQAIQDACQFFGAERVKLEIEILEDAKSGIFGLVGARKARVNARLVQLSTGLESVKSEAKARKSASSASKPAPAKVAKPLKARTAPTKVEQSDDVEAEELPKSTRPQVKETRSYDKPKAYDKPKPFSRQQNVEDDDEEDESQRKFLSKIIADTEEELDDNILASLDREAMARANLLGNMTEAEIRASGQAQASDRRNTRGRENSRPRNDRERAPLRDRNPRERNDRDRNDSRGQMDRTDRTDRTNSERSFAPRGRTQTDSRRDESVERKQYYEQKRQQQREQREARPPKPTPVEYDAPALPRVPLEELDTEKLLTFAREIITTLVGPVVGFEVPIEVKIADDRVYISIESEDTGLLIGREGQHLAAIQYLASRILTRKMESQVRIQVDTGDYHSRQDSRMEFLAHALADKVKHSGRPQSTRPLSAYQRRVIHVALQEETEIQTRSCGDGTLKRVIIMRRRNTNNKLENADINMEEVAISEIDKDIDVFAEEPNNVGQDNLGQDNLADVSDSMENESK